MSILSNTHGILIALEGIDGAGKTTVANLLADKFGKNGFDAVIVKAPDERFRDFLSRNSFSRPGKVLLYLADMIESYRNIIVPNLREGRVVITDRSVLSTLVYQKLLPMYGDDPEACILRKMLDAPCDLITHYDGDIRKVTLTVLLDIPARVGMQRSSSHVKDEYESADLEEWMLRVRMYRAMFDRIGEFRVDAVKLSADEVADTIFAEALRRYALMFGVPEVGAQGEIQKGTLEDVQDNDQESVGGDAPQKNAAKANGHKEGANS